MTLPFQQALWFLPFVAPICLWVAWSDMKTMKIPNKAVIAMVAVFVVVGLLALPLGEFAWRLLNLVVVLAIGFALNMLRLIGAGDAKFAATMAPFILLGDAFSFLFMFSGVLIAAFVTHRIAKRIPAVRRATSDWKSWEVRDFPMGLALGSAMIIYLLMGLSAGT